MGNFIDGFFENRGSLRIPQQNITTGGLEVGGTGLIDLAVNTAADLVALSTTTYDGMSVVVKNPGGQAGYGWGTVAGIPARAYCYNSAWHWENGVIILGIYADALQLTVPAATFTSVSVAAGAGGYSTKCALSSAGVHGLTTANAVTIPCKIRITAGTGWTPGDYPILEVTDADTVTIDYTYDAGLGTPTIVLAHASTEVEIVRIKVPIPLTTRAKFIIEGSVKTPVAAAGAMRLKLYLGNTGEDYSTAGLIHNINYGTNASSGSFHAGFQLQNSKTVQKGILITTNASGYGVATSGDMANLTETMTSSTDIIAMALLETADRPLRIDSIIVSMYDA
jgi:hypothetical protein